MSVRLITLLAVAVSFAATRADADSLSRLGLTGEIPLAEHETDRADMITAGNPGPYDANLLLVLSLFDRDPNPEELEHFEPGLREQLEAIALDEDVMCLARTRALSALGYFDDEQAFDIVVSVARDADALHRLRMSALWTLGNRFENRDGREPILEEALGEADHTLRLQAVLSLAEIDTEKAHQIIDSHRIAERHVAVRSFLRDLLEKREGASRVILPEGALRGQRVMELRPRPDLRDEAGGEIAPGKKEVR